MKETDSGAINRFGIPSTLLMTNAAEAVAKAALGFLPEGGSAAVFCGCGNNGGDGVAAACRLLTLGYDARVFFTSDIEVLSPDTAEMLRRLRELRGQAREFSASDAEQLDFIKGGSVIIDAILGTGLSRMVSGVPKAAVELINSLAIPVVSADVPSGVDADTGKIYGCAVSADITVTFTLAKPGHFVEPGCVKRGKLIVADIGIPQTLTDELDIRAFAVTKDEVSLPKRLPLTHKGNYGRLLLLGGSVGCTGAPTLAARAALRVGAGLVSLGVPEEIYQISAVKNDEAMPFPLKSRDGILSPDALDEILQRAAKSNVTVVGMGLGRSAETPALVEALVNTCKTPLLIDADGLYAIKDRLEGLKNSEAQIVLTPHEGEFALLGASAADDRLSAARELAQKRRVTVVLKGHRTICAFPGGEVYIINAGNPGMAKGGTGDALSGVIGAMLCQLPFKQAVITGCWLHARAGDFAAERLGEYSITASDLIDSLSDACKEITCIM
jgi:NAD(P)H-hydrate epimerase